jgi:Tfp pilus assembly major pilin PilA
MKLMKWAILAVLAGVMGVAIAADAPPAAEGPRSPAGMTAIKKYQNARAKAEAAYKQALSTALLQERDELEAAKTAAMKAGNLDEANRCDAAKKKVMAQTSEEPTTAPANGVGNATANRDWGMHLTQLSITGSHWTRGAATVDYLDNGVVNLTGEPARTWKVVAPGVVKQSGDDGDILVTFSPDYQAAVWQTPKWGVFSAERIVRQGAK